MEHLRLDAASGVLTSSLMLASGLLPSYIILENVRLNHLAVKLEASGVALLSLSLNAVRLKIYTRTCRLSWSPTWIRSLSNVRYRLRDPNTNIYSTQP